jgi:translation initiation factor 1
MSKILKNRSSSIVYSTFSDLTALNEEVESAAESVPASITLGIRLEKKGRAGKMATLIFGVEALSAEGRIELAKSVRVHCGTGGSVNEEHILLQGDQVVKAMKYLQNKGFKVKKIGG